MLSVIGISSLLSYAPGWWAALILSCMILALWIVRFVFGCSHWYKHMNILRDFQSVSTKVSYYALNLLVDVLYFIMSFIGPVPILRVETFFGGCGFAYSVLR